MTWKRQDRHVPFHLQLTVTNIAVWIIIPGRTKFHKLRFISTSETQFSRLIETSNDMVQILKEIRLGEKSYNYEYDDDDCGT